MNQSNIQFQLSQVDQHFNQEEATLKTNEHINIDKNKQSRDRLICVDLGCGIHKAEGFIGVDIAPADGVDVIANLNETFPFSDSSIDVVKAHNILEHLPNIINSMNELWRILKPNGIVDISVPSTDGRGAFQDPTHVSFWNINSFMYYSNQYPAYFSLCKTYGFKGEFNIVEIKEVRMEDSVQIYVVLKAIKSEKKYSSPALDSVITVKNEPKELINPSIFNDLPNIENEEQSDNENYTDWQLDVPVVLIFFNRVDTTQKVFNIIRQAKPPKLFVICDAPRPHKKSDVEQCQAAKAIINQVDWECEVFTNYSDVNLGPRKCISSGLNWVFEQVEEAIVLEHDCLPHLTFFRYCQELLKRYRDNEQIMVISGNNFQYGRKRTEYSYYFSRYSHIWGWATWRRAWQKYDVSIKKWKALRETTWLYDFLQNEQATAYWSRVFDAVLDGFETWDYSLLFSLWVNQALCILPEINLVSNIGFGPNAENCKDSSSPLANMPVVSMNSPLKHPTIVTQNLLADNFTEMTLFSKGSQHLMNVQKPQASAQNLVDLFNKGRYELVQGYIDANSQTPLTLYLKAIVDARLGNIDLAKDSLQEILAKDPSCLKARVLLNELNEKSRQEVENLMNEALGYYNQGETIKALRLGEKAASLEVFVPGLHYLRSIFHSSVARYEEALEAAELELKLNPQHSEALIKVNSLRKALIKPKKEKIPNSQRTWNTSLPYELMMSIQNSVHNYLYRGVPIQKNPFDFAIYPLLMWQLKPRTIIEIGSKSGGSALWFGDLLTNFGINGHIYSVDIVKVIKYSHPNVTFLEGDGQNLQETFSDDFLKKLHHPLLIIEDADHSFQTSKSVLEFFHPYLDQGEYIVIEDGIISDIVQDKLYQSGPHKALKFFVEKYDNEYEIDSEYCDFFGYNLTWSTNGYLKKLTTAQVQSLNSYLENAEFQELCKLIQPYTVLSEARLYSLFTLAKRVCQENIPGNFVECGVAAGGSTALLATVIQRYTKQPRRVYAFDSFDGMPAPTEKDKSNGLPADETGWGTGTCAAPEASVREICNLLGVEKIVQLVKGYFEETLPQMCDRVGMIAFLHMDGDWYESTKTILVNLYDRLSNHAYVQVDDYGFWEGCRQAIHEFEAERKLQFELNKINSTGVWFQCGENFPVNPAIELDLIQEFREDDPVSYGIQSQMSQNERFQLYYALRKLLPVTEPLRFVEIGSFAGSSLFLNYKTLARISSQLQGWAIEPGMNSQLRSVLDNLPDSITHLQSYSHDALPRLQEILEDQYLSYIFVDGDHSYEGVKQDIINYFPLLASGGLMIFHDYLPPLNDRNRDAILFHHGGNEPGIRQACEELMENTYHCEIMEIPLLYPDDPTQTQAFLPVIPDVFSTLKVYRKP